MSKEILSAAECAAISPAAASSIEVAALQRTVAAMGKWLEITNETLTRSLAAMAAVDLAMANGTPEIAAEWVANSQEGLPYADPDDFMRDPQLLYNALTRSKPCSFPGCPWRSVGHSSSAAWCSPHHQRALVGELADVLCATCPEITVCPWWVPGSLGPRYLCGPCWEKHRPKNAGALQT